MGTNGASTLISIYKNIHDAKSRETVGVDIFLDAVYSGKWQDMVLQIRLIKDHSERQEAKKNLPYVTISGVFSDGRSISGLSAHSGFISMDLDGLGSDLEGVRALLSKDPYVYSCFTSVSGAGLCVLFRIDPEKHREAFDGIASYLLTQYQLICDPSGKDVSRPRYVSYDPDLYKNEKSVVFKKYLPKPKDRKIQATIFVASEFERIIQEMIKSGVSCVDDYRDWRDIGYGLADQFGEAGRQYYHALSSCSSKYEQSNCDRQYTYCLRGNGKSGNKITIATIYWYAKQAGIKIHSDRTNKIAAATSTMKRAGLDAKGIAENLKKFEGIENVDDIIKQAFAANTNFTSGESMVENLRMWMRQNYSLKRNLVTRKIENNGRVLDEIDLNTMYLEALIAFDKLTFELFCKVMFSSNTAQYNPIHDFFTENIDLKPSGVIDEFFSCFTTENDLLYFGKKWLVSIVASAYGKHSPLMLIFAGEKQGTGKTEAFRRMVPDQLKPYYAEISQGIKDTDLNIMLAQKLIVMDDECGGKSKKDAIHLKSMLSKQIFTLREPYGKMNVDLDRLAVLCGTTNDLEILNDIMNRRLIPVEITFIDFDMYNMIDKTQLFMEAYHLYESGFNWQISGQDIDQLAEKTDKFQETSIENEMIQKFFRPSNDFWYTASEIKNKLETLTVQKYTLRRIGMELKRLGYVRIKKMGVYVYMLEEIDRGSSFRELLPF